MGKVGAKATRASRTFDGKWVKTMVLSRPKRRASGTAARNGERQEEVRSKKQDGERRERHAKSQMEEERHQALHHQPSGQRVDAEERGQPPHDAARAIKPRRKTLPQALDLDRRTLRRFHR